MSNLKTEWEVIPSLTFLKAKVLKIPIKGNSKGPVHLFCSHPSLEEIEGVILAFLRIS